MIAETVTLPAWHPAVIKAACWLRQHLNSSMWDTIDKEFEEYFNCKIIRGERITTDGSNTTVCIEFAAPEHTAFMLRWS
jgi:hypothetical protein